MAGRTAQKCYGDAPGVLPSESCLEEEEPGPLSQQLQATSSSGSEPLSNLDLSHESLVDLQYLPFFRTYGHLLSEEELALQPEVCRDLRGDWGIRGAPFQEDLEPPSGFFPYYHSKEESFSSLLCGGSQDPPTRMEVQAGCFCRRTVSSRSSAASADPDLVSGSSPTCRPTPLASAGHSHDSCLDAPLSSDAALSGHVLRASGFVPYYRTPEEELHSSPGPPASSSGGQEPTGELPRPGAATL
uniref:Uncharacterized protein n=1 Tax=Rousettus aegyptiacus TaxID=9407 RepID=A0A7J8FJE6_ROUAE|nr:hypothetical protein HJG63_012137 [Rousettus aegyptiacus]